MREYGGRMQLAADGDDAHDPRWRHFPHSGSDANRRLRNHQTLVAFLKASGGVDVGR